MTASARPKLLVTVAQACLDLAAQHASAWTEELDLRPFAEAF